MIEVAGGGRLSGRRDRAWVLGLVVLAFALRIWQPGPLTQTYDEDLWLARTDNSIDAVKTGDFDRATARYDDVVATMPGVTTMLAGTAGRFTAKVSHRLGLSDAVEGPSTSSAQVLRAGRAYVSLACAIALGALVWLASALLGRRAALIAGVVLATDPFLAGHSGLLHTDALVTMFGALAVVAAMAAFWTRPDPGDEEAVGPVVRRGPLAVSAVAAALALLTKMNAIPILAPSIALVGAVELARRLWTAAPGRRLRSIGPLAAAGAAWAVGVAVVAVALWPALWTSPMTQFHFMVDSADIPHNTSIDRSISAFGRRSFVGASLLFRLTPWMLVGGVLSAVAAVAVVAGRPRADWRVRAGLAVLLLGQVPYVVIIERSEKAYDRYLLTLWPVAALLLGVAVAWLADQVAARWTVPAVPARVAVGVVVAALALVPVVEAPYNTAWIDPLLGGDRAERTIPLGWGEGAERLGHVIAERQHGDCDVRVAMRDPLPIAVPCGQLVLERGRTPLRDIRYLIYEVRHRQRGSVPAYDAWIQQAHLVDEVVIQGVVYAQLWEAGPA